MNELGYLSAFLVGLLGGVHCVGMCGGIVSAVTLGLSPQKNSAGWQLHLGYNAGRLFSYVLAGAIMGGLGLMLAGFVPVKSAQNFLLLLAGVFMILLGLYLGGWWNLLLRLEQAGGVIWQRIKPLSNKLLPVKTVPQALLLGMVWGWIPCGLVYSVLIWSVGAGSVIEGALLMLAFGAGTLPNLLAMGVVAEKIKHLTQKTTVRQFVGVIIIVLGGVNIWQVI